MRNLFATLIALLAPLASGWSLDPFADTAPVEFSFVETYNDVVVEDPDFGGEYLLEGRNEVNISGSARLALTPEQLAEIDELTEFEIGVGDFNYSGSLGEDQNFDPLAGDRIVKVPLEGFDFDGNEIRIGTIELRWSATSVLFNAHVQNAPDDYSVVADDYHPGVTDPGIDRDDLLAEFSFGSFGFDTRTVYMRGSATVSQVVRGGEVFNVSDIQIEGSIDSLPPNIVITQPADGVTKLTTNDVTDGKYTLAGTASDSRNLGASNFPGKVIAVDVQFGPADNLGPFVAANFDENTGIWVLPNAPIEAGRNSLIVRALDSHGNLRLTSKRTITYTSKGDLTVTAVAVGYGPEDAGEVVGTISGEELVGKANQFDVIAGVVTPLNKRSLVESGQIFRVVAKSNPGTSFDGWTGTINGVTRFTAVNPLLDFETRPNLIVTARFVPNPFGPLTGTYHGLANGSGAQDRGTFLIKVRSTGAFTGKVTVGTVALPLKGIVLGGGHWSGTVTKNGKQFVVSFDLNVSDTGDRLLTGTVTGENMDSSFEGDRNGWRKPKKNDPGNTAEPYMGTYNVVLPADFRNSDGNFPAGIGYGRIKITKLGGVSFVGQLGDGSKAKSAAVLVKRESGPVFFYLFVPLDKKRGNCAGIVTYDNTQTGTDITGTLDWSEPSTSGVNPEGFEGKILLSGSLYQKPSAGTRVILQGAGGNGILEISAPAYTKPAKDNALPVFIKNDPANLSIFNKTGPLGAESVKIEFSAVSGLFHGTYKDPDLRKNVSFFGAAVQKMNGGAGYAGGVFVRGNQAGSVEFRPATP